MVLASMMLAGDTIHVIARGVCEWVQVKPDVGLLRWGILLSLLVSGDQQNANYGEDYLHYNTHSQFHINTTIFLKSKLIIHAWKSF